MKSQIFLLSLGLLGSGLAHAHGAFAVVDMGAVMESSPQMAKIRKDLESEFSVKAKAHQKKIEQLNSDVAKLNKERPVLDKATLQKKEADLMKRQQEIGQEEQSLQQTFMQKQQVAMEELSSKIQAEAAKIAKNKGYDTVLQKNVVIVANASDDITAQVKDALKK